jgi:uncharacterized protein YbaR (Trm112 family)/SAM-dependent methyltransferase
MWKRFGDILRCPCCQGRLDITTLEEHQVQLKPEEYTQGEKLGIQSDKFNKYVESGMLLCEHCKYWFPILYGLPVMLPYKTPITEEFIGKNKNHINKFADKYTVPKGTPKPGEQFVLRSFSKEWLEYEYDGIIWGWSYEDREKTLLTEMGVESGEITGAKFIEIGCGLGITTDFAQKNYQGDAVGVDLSLAVLKATNHFRDNPFLHFAQATLFQPPFQKKYFDLMYSHGVLHHTYSTKEAFHSVAPYCKDDGWAYIWVYGRGGQTESWDRKLGHYAEVLLRPVLSRMPTSVVTTALSPIALGYIIFNFILRLNNPTLQTYNFSRALHAARDRFTPRFASRHSYNEVESWFNEFGFKNIQRIDWQKVSPAVHALFRRSVGVRGQRKIDLYKSDSFYE